MSPITKLFVILLVITSLLTASAVSVFVNKVNVFDAKDKDSQQILNASKRDLQNALADAATARGRMVAEQQLAAAEAASKQEALNTAVAALAAKDAENKNLTRNNQTQEANVQGIKNLLDVALETNKKDTDTINALRDDSAKKVQAQAETDAALARQRQLAETYGRQVEYLTEQVKKLQELANGGPKNTSGVAAPGAAPQVSGVVRDKQNINGVTYLTISVGAADSVQTGMEFSVVDPAAQPPQFLGILTITQTDANSAIGRLQADEQMVTKVKQGNAVTTHLQ